MKSPVKTLIAISVMSMATVSVAAAQSPADNNDVQMSEKMNPPDKEAMQQRADSDMNNVLQALKNLGGKPIETLSAPEARKQPTPADAVNVVLKEKGLDPDKVKENMHVATKDLTYGNNLPVRIYTPEDKRDNEKLPVIVYYHGGGWVIADIDVYDASPRSLANKAHAIVVSAEYRLAPEHKFPAAHEDAFAAYQWTLKNAASWGGDPRRIAVVGESAGGNLAANVAIMARDNGVQPPVHMVLVYPVAGSDMMTESYIRNANAKPLSKPMMEWFVQNALTQKDKNDPRIDLVHANLKDLPSATIITAEIDPLMSEGKMLADRLQAANVKTVYKNYEGVAHEFFGMAAVVKKADEAQDFAVDQLQKSFGPHGPTEGSVATPQNSPRIGSALSHEAARTP